MLQYVIKRLLIYHDIAYIAFRYCVFLDTFYIHLYLFLGNYIFWNLNIMDIAYFSKFNDILNLNFIIDILPLFWQALLLTLEISFYGIFGAIFIGFISSLVIYYKIRPFVWITRVYIEISRNTPLIIHLFFLYFGLSYWIEIPNFWCAVLGVIFLGGSYMAESFRLGLESVRKTQIESALSLGFSHIQILCYVIFPQSIPLSIPSICANILFLIKETSIVGVIALQDLMSIAKEVISNYGQTNEALFLLICAYLIVLLPLSLIFSRLEHHYRRNLL